MQKNSSLDPGLQEQSRDTTASSQSSKRKRKYKLYGDPAKKRQLHKNFWIRTQKKKAVNEGMEWKNDAGEVEVKRRRMKTACGESCRFKCQTKVSDDQRQKILKTFWDIGHKERQWYYLSSLIQFDSSDCKTSKISLNNLEASTANENDEETAESNTRHSIRYFF